MTTFLYAVLQRTSFANVIMIMLIIGGLLSFMFIRQELFPTMQSRQVEIMVGLPGASPEEVDRSVIMTIENTLRGMDGIKRIDAEAREGTGVVTATLLESAEPQQVLADIKSGVDRIENLPADAEKPIITIPAHVEKALSVIVYGDQPLLWLRQAAETMRDDLRTGLGTGVGLQQVQLAFAPDGEISVEIAEDTLRHYGITLEEVALEIRKSAPDLPGGTLYTGESEIVLRTSKQREWAADLSDVIVAQTAAGFPLYLKDIASLKDGNGRSSIECWFNGLPALQIDIYVTANETPREVEKIVRDYLESVASEKFQGVETVIFENQAAAYQSRMALLVENALLGLLLVLIILGLFLTPQMAFWVMVSIPTTLLGGLLLLPLFGGTINMISMFAFIVTIGVVVDDAIMIGEAIHTHRARGLTMLAAAVQGVQEMGGLVFLATLTTIIAFMPMFFVPGDMGVLFYQIPAVVVAVLVVSLLESLFILAAHVSVDHPENRLLKILARPQYWVNRRLNSFIELWFRPFLLRCLKCQPSLFGTAILIVLLTVGGVAGGLLNFSFTPTIAADMVIAQAALPYGSPRNESITVMKRLVDAAEEVLEKNGMSSKGIFSLIGTRLEEG
ncbi:MAG: efflux RND transporter permease subunit, partial [Desulfopila sp.]|nr:efflux RND transporter permease subunit [Desulfopila sp.]